LTPDRVVAACASLILFVIVALALFRPDTRGRLERATIVLFSLVWAVSLALYALPWIEYSRPTVGAWATIYGSIAAFLAACVLTQKVAASAAPSRSCERLAPARLHLGILFTAILGYVGFAFFLRAVNRTVGWTTLFTDLHAVRKVQEGTQFGQEYGTVKVLTYFSGISLLLWTLALRERTLTGKWRLLAPIGLVVLVPYFFLGERLSLLTVIMWIAAFHLLWRPIRSPRQVAVVALAATLAALGFFFLIGYNKGATIQNHPELRSQLTTRHFEQLAFPYLYLTANVPVFSKLTRDPIAPRTYGALTLWPAAKLSNLALRRNDYPPKYGAFYNIPFDAYNSATWLGPFYLDFGAIGSIVIPAIFGFITTGLLVLALRRRTLTTVWLAALGVMIVAFSPLKDAFSDASTWEFIIMAPVAAFFVTDRSTDTAQAGDLPRHRRRGVWIALGLVALVAVAAFVGVRLHSSPARDETSARAVTARLTRAGGKLARVFDREGAASSPHVLATRLGVSDPAGTYEDFYAPGDVPPRGVVGVFATSREFRLRARTSEGAILEVVGVKSDGNYRVVGPRIVRSGLVSNGGFESSLIRPWHASSETGVAAQTTVNALDGAYSLRLQYSRRRPSSATSVTQLIRPLPVRAAQTRYTLREDVLTRNLSRQVTCGFQLIYADGTSHYVPGTRGSLPPTSTKRATGILAGSQPNAEVTASGVATKRVAAIRVFAVDAGTQPLRGVIVVDNVRLTTKPPASH
jgi:oligosaccharide repeat unit polymerase